MWHLLRTQTTKPPTTSLNFSCVMIFAITLVIVMEKHLDVVEQGTRRIRLWTVPVDDTVLPAYLPNDLKQQKKFLFSPS